MSPNPYTDFPWTFDQFQRYNVLGKLLRMLYGIEEERSGRDREDVSSGSIILSGENRDKHATRDRRLRVLDVGGAALGKTTDGQADKEVQEGWLPVREIALGEFDGFATDIVFCPAQGFVQASGGMLPFKDGSFDVVSALDVFEHVPAEGRETFVKELCRVSRDFVFLCGPYKNEAIEKAEAIVAEEIRRLYGIEHAQLLEHKERGLPSEGQIEEILSRETNSEVVFGYGSLGSWLIYQSYRNRFLGRRNSARVLGLLDGFLARQNQAPEFEPPFYRKFWIYSKTMPREEIAPQIEKIKHEIIAESHHELSEKSVMTRGIEDENLRLTQSDEDLMPSRGVGQGAPGGATFSMLLKEIEAYFHQNMISALIISSGEKERLGRCLDHILSQKVDLDLEVAVWDLSAKESTARLLQEKFPAVRRLALEKGERTANALIKAALALRGNYFLFVAEDVLLPNETVQTLYKKIKEGEAKKIEAGLSMGFSSTGGREDLSEHHPLISISPRIVWKRYFSRILGGGRRSWQFSECLLFPRTALYELKMGNRRAGKKNIFYWRNAGKSRKIIFLKADKIRVYKK